MHHCQSYGQFKVFIAKEQLEYLGRPIIKTPRPYDICPNKF